MTKYRIGWTTALFGCVMAFLLLDTYAGLYLFIGILLMLVSSVLFMVISRPSITAEIELAKSCRKGQPVRGKIRLRNSKRTVLFKSEIQIIIKNILTGEETGQVLVIALTGKKEQEVDFNLNNQLCGNVQVILESACVYDMTGVWKKRIMLDEKSNINVIPDTFGAEIQLMTGMLEDNESIDYSKEKPGDDMSELFGIREYREGDNVRNIHWKLTGKSDDIMVKLPSLPLENSILLLMETSEEKEQQPAIYDALAEIYVTLSQTLIHNNISHQIGWYDHNYSGLFTFDIESEDDLLSAMARILSASHQKGAVKAHEYYIREHGDIDRAHLVYISAESEPSLAELSAEIRKTAVICNKGGAGGAVDGILTYYCSPDNYPQQLQFISI